MDPNALYSSIKGAMAMGLSLSSRESVIFDSDLKVLTSSLRNYKILHIGQEPEYIVKFVETPQVNSPYGARVYSEHGIIGMPAALANALSLAADNEVYSLPITPESLWNLDKKKGKLL
jgi:CO/xanthine dehydrogenase Mo-binding subunit